MTHNIKKNAGTEKTVSYLNTAFMKATEAAAPRIGNKSIRTVTKNRSRNSIKTTQLYDYQVEFCYLINEIQLGPIYMVTKVVSNANALIAEINALR